MRAQNSQEEEIPIRSDFDTSSAERVLAEDEEDFSTLKQVFVIIREAENKSGDMNTLDLSSDAKLSADQQALAYQFALNELILPVKTLLMDTIGEIKLKQRGIVNG